jgi:hypothetical protein
LEINPAPEVLGNRMRGTGAAGAQRAQGTLRFTQRRWLAALLSGAERVQDARTAIE